MTASAVPTYTTATSAGSIPVPALPTACPGVVIVPVLDVDDDNSEPVYTGLWKLRHETGRAIVGSEHMYARANVDAAYDLAERLAALGLDWTANDAGADWPDTVRDRVKALFMEES